MMKMPPRDQHVGGDHELMSAPCTHDRSVVAHAEHRAGRGVREEAADQLEFGKCHERVMSSE
jgi:hypothetical protein